MRTSRPGLRVWRAAVAVVALYALALQAVLGAALPAPAFDPAHVLCLAEARTAPGDPEKAPADHVHPSCCTAAHAPAPLAAPTLAAAAIAWPVRRTASAVFRPEIVAAPRAPPATGARPRAPPVV